MDRRPRQPRTPATSQRDGQLAEAARQLQRLTQPSAASGAGVCWVDPITGLDLAALNDLALDHAASGGISFA